MKAFCDCKLPRAKYRATALTAAICYCGGVIVTAADRAEAEALRKLVLEEEAALRRDTATAARLDTQLRLGD